MSSYPTPAFRRTALAPAILGAIALIAGLPLLGTSGFLWILFAVSILAIIVCVFAVQAGQWWWLIGLGPVAIVWNPIFPIPMEPLQLFAGLQYVAAIIFIVAGVLIKVRNPEDRNRR